MIENFKLNDIFCRIYKPEDNIEQVLVTVHGFSGDKDSSVICALGKNLSPKGVMVISFDLPCHGEDERRVPLTVNLCRQALERVILYAKTMVSNDKITIFATSFGAYLTLNYLLDHKEKFKNIILRAPAINMPDILEKWIFEQRKLSFDELKKGVNFGFEKSLIVSDVLYEELKSKQIKDVFYDDRNNFYILQGLKDDIVDPEEVFDFCDRKLKNRYEIFKFKDADHRFKKEGELEKIIEITQNILFC